MLANRSGGNGTRFPRPTPAGQAPVRTEPGIGVDGPRPSMAEADGLELGKGDEEVRRQPAVRLGTVLVPGIDLAPEMVDRVVPTEHDPVVLGHAVVVKL